MRRGLRQGVEFPNAVGLSSLAEVGVLGDGVCGLFAVMSTAVYGAGWAARRVSGPSTQSTGKWNSSVRMMTSCQAVTARLNGV